MKDTLPEEQWWCVWCDARPPTARFRRREHVIAEGLGGHRNFRLLRGLVCDECNAGFLQKIDEEMMLLPHIRLMRSWLGVGPASRQVAPGFEFDRARGEGLVDTTKMNAGTSATVDVAAPGGPSFTVTSMGPSTSPRVGNEHAVRGFHRMAYNAVVHARGADYARTHLAFLRELVRDVTLIGRRAALINYSAFERAVLAPPKVIEPSRYDLILDPDGEIVDGVELHVGVLQVFVSVRASTAPLAPVAGARPDLFVYSSIDEA